jgi:phage terminase large subunit-like protein
MKNPDNRVWVTDVLAKSKELIYQFEPYFNRRDGKQGWQWKFLEMAKDHKGRIALGGNRIGKSKMGAYESVLSVIGQHPYRKYPDEGEGWIIGLDFNMVKTIDLPMFESFLPGRFKKAFSNRDNQPMWEIEGDGRHWIVRFKSADSGRSKFQGAAVDWIWFDEEPGKTDIFAECEQRLVDRAGIWWMTATPVLGTTWLRALANREDVWSNLNEPISQWDNPYLPQEEIERTIKNYPEDEVDVRVEGKYMVFGGKPVFRTCMKQLNDRLNELKMNEPEIGIIAA